MLLALKLINESFWFLLQFFYSDKDDENSGHPRKVTDAVKKACFSPEAEEPISFELSSVTGSSKLPTLQKLQASYLDLCDTCFCHSNKDFWATDSSWLGKVDGSRYVHEVPVLKI